MFDKIWLTLLRLNDCLLITESLIRAFPLNFVPNQNCEYWHVRGINHSILIKLFWSTVKKERSSVNLSMIFLVRVVPRKFCLISKPGKLIYIRPYCTWFVQGTCSCLRTYFVPVPGTKYASYRYLVPVQVLLLLLACTFCWTTHKITSAVPSCTYRYISQVPLRRSLRMQDLLHVP